MGNELSSEQLSRRLTAEPAMSLSGRNYSTEQNNAITNQFTAEMFEGMIKTNLFHLANKHSESNNPKGPLRSNVSSKIRKSIANYRLHESFKNSLKNEIIPHMSNEQKLIRKRIIDGIYLKSDFDTLQVIQRYCGLNRNLSNNVIDDLCMLEWALYRKCSLPGYNKKAVRATFLRIEGREGFPTRKKLRPHIYRELCSDKSRLHGLPKDVAKIIISFCCGKRYKHILIMFDKE